MKYEFNRSRLTLLSICMLLLLLLSFAAGVVTGIGLWMPTRSEIALLKRKPAAEVTLASAPPTHTPPPQPPPAAAASPEPPPTTAEAVPAPPAPVTVAAEVPAAASPEDDGSFVIQLGSFRDEKNAKQLQGELKERGYAAKIMTALDGDQREWHVVRMGSYKTVAVAAKAAADFTAKERIQALVRRSSAL
jgi:DedD protein